MRSAMPRQSLRRMRSGACSMLVWMIRSRVAVMLIKPWRRPFARGVLGYGLDGGVHFGHHVVVQLLVDAGKASGLANVPAHALAAERGTKTVVSSRGSAMLIRLSAMKEAGKSGLSSAARPTLAQNSS